MLRRRYRGVQFCFELLFAFMRPLPIAVGIVVAANALTITIVSILTGGGAGIDAGIQDRRSETVALPRAGSCLKKAASCA